MRMCYVSRGNTAARMFPPYKSSLLREYPDMAKKGGAPTKSEITATISKDTELSRKQVSGVFESLNGIIRKSLRSHGIDTAAAEAWLAARA